MCEALCIFKNISVGSNKCKNMDGYGFIFMRGEKRDNKR